MDVWIYFLIALVLGIIWAIGIKRELDKKKQIFSIKNLFSFTLIIIRNKKYQWIATIFVLAVVLFLSSSIRTSNWDLLTDSTTGEKIPIALDPYYFLRVSETIAENGGSLPEFDVMRAPGFDVKWSLEIMPRVIVEMWKIANVFGEYSLQAVNVFSPVLFYGIGLVLFFILVYILTKSKLAGVLASAFLAFNPSYLYRTMAGFSDHEAIGMIGFFGAMIGYVLTLKYLERTDGKNLVWGGIAGLIMGALTALTIVTWGGVSTFLFMIIPIGFLLFWIVRLQDKNSGIRNSGILYYVCWMVFTVVFGLIFGYSYMNVVSRFLNSTGIISVAVLGFIILDRLFIYFEDKIKIKSYNENYRMIYVFVLLMILGIVALPLIGKNFFGLVWEILNLLLNPQWNTDRLNTTVAENAQPYLSNWIGNIGKHMFYLFLLGIAAFGIEFSKKIKPNKNRIFVLVGVLALAFGILFSRYSPTSILNGTGIFSLSGLAYLGGIGLFVYALFKAYANGKIDIGSASIVVFSWMFVMLIVGRSTTRLFFVIAPFVCFFAAYFVISMFRYFRLKNSDEIVKILVIGLLIVSVVLSVFIINSFYKNVSAQAKNTGPSAGVQWQSAMSWIRENTDSDAVFSHWWDYGYWVQTLGKRATVADGGHPQGVYDGNHKIGRYVLTTPRPETALSFFKTMGVDYFLIDQTDLGKYSAYSKIGGGNGEDSLDRFAAIPVMLADVKQTRETANGTMFVYSGGSYIFEDIVYDGVFLPSGKAAIIGIFINLNGGSLGQPTAVYVYNNIQTRIPLRYAYIGGQLIDYESGLDAVIDIIPAFDGGGINQMGAAIYLSQKVSKGLFAQLYLLNDAFGNYPMAKVAHIENDPVVAAMKSQGAPIGNFVYYQGFRGPIKIWDVSDIPEGINIVPEFREPFSGFGSLDDLDFGEI